ncbi:hypothetical protein [Fulvivirga sediminis]|uniref:Uncharacterized protein n=1 Tax=Fulvivirga sediminis TaxID=2803949 RepID=A0A937FD95_9BACT|nr:hypothetical protein [Fulvivirga sediminis]MBL3658639.1 hypothetical protein [Fulvivirga sediminis]
MKIDFTKLQKAFIIKIKEDENLTLRGQDVSFEINPNYEFEQHNLTIRIKVFGEEFSVGYPKENTSIDELILDFYSRLHDCNTDNARHHIIGLKILQLQNRFSEEIISLREKLIRKYQDLKPEEIVIDFSDLPLSENDLSGFPKFGIFIVIKGKQVLMREIGFDEFNYKLDDELETKITERLKN